MMIILAFTFLWLGYTFIGPVTISGPGGRRNPLYITLPRQVSPSGNDPRAVRIQEVGEWRLAKLIGCAFGIIVGVCLTAIFKDLTVSVLLVCYVFGTILGDAISYPFRTIDLAGHGAEILKAEELHLHGYRENEIRRMQTWEYRELSVDQLRLRLTELEWLSRIILRLGEWNSASVFR